MNYFIFIALVAIGFYFFSKKNIDSIYDEGKIAASQIDIFDFMGRDFSSLNSAIDKAVFHFLVNRSWRESDEWFNIILQMDDDSNKEAQEFINEIRVAMLGDSALEIASKLMPIPREVRKLRPSDYAEWSRLHQATIKENPNLKVIRFVSASSVMAARSCVKAMGN